MNKQGEELIQFIVDQTDRQRYYYSISNYRGVQSSESMSRYWKMLWI